jgi:hypothetical protein
MEWNSSMKELMKHSPLQTMSVSSVLCSLDDTYHSICR